MSSLPMVRVIWNDAQDDAQVWSRLDELGDDPCIVTTVGSLLSTVRQGHVSVALSWHPDEDGEPVVGSVLHIPSAMVLTLEHLGILPA